MIYLKNWFDSMGSDSDTAKKSLNIFPDKGEAASLVRATIEITREDLKTLRERVLSKLPDTGKEDLHLSTFVLTYAYITTCIVRSRRGNGDRDVAFGFTIDCRPRLDPPVPENYFGNCNTISSGMEKKLSFLLECYERLKTNPFQAISVAGSPGFGVYGSDFGWGKPVKVDVVSIDKNEAVSLAESRDGSRGVEVGLALKKHEMEKFFSLFLSEF
ncbi:putative HXXXD-type acyl-transferase family protein [Hibiscus syriacus]|uniref:HXXXD-type acyl-transferase family protein n=1 Tax=Hibiscus syriacus TaxID=106335 RepID=A0A6A2X4H7_HIBSY|nr:putative HXXXD-type acyl-transferase family protein [Hibiscus syriacus]